MIKSVMKWISFLISLLFSAVCSAQVIENPVFDRTEIPQFHIDKIEITKDTTFVYCSCSAEENSWANISPDTYLEEIATGKKYNILKSEGLPFTPDVRKFIFAEKYTIKLSFPCIYTANKLNFIENAKEKAFNIYGISLTESNDTICKYYTIEKANALSTSSSYYFSIKNYDKAIDNEEPAMRIRRYWLGRYNEMYDHSVYMLGHYYSMIGNYDEAEKYLSESVNIREILYGKDKEPYIDALTMLATCYANQDKVTKAIQTYEQAISFIESNNISYTRAKSLLARAYFSIGDIPKAIDYTEDVVRINKVLVGEKDEEYLYPLFDLAKWYMWTNITKSKSICEDLVLIIKPNYGRKHPLYLYTINLLSQYYMLQNDGENALAYAKESMELSSEIYGNRSVEYGLSLNLMYQIYDMLLHDYDKAIQYQLDFISITKSEMGFDVYSNSLRHVAESFAKKEDYANAFRYASDAINAFKDNVIPEFGKMSNEQKYSIWQKGHFYFDTGYPFYVFMNQNDASLKDMYNNTLFFKGITLNEHLNENYTWDNIRKSLKTNDIAIEFIASHEQDSLFCYYALIIKKEYESPKMIRLFDTSQFGEILGKHLPAFELNKHLGTLIWGSINKELVDVKNIFFSPAGLFHEISIEYLPINQIENYSDKYNMYRVSSTRELIHIVLHNHYTNAVLYGGIDYNLDENTPSKEAASSRSGFDFLLNTEEEVSDISHLLNNNGINTIIYKGQEGSESVFYNLPLKPIDIIHMATHGQSIKSDEVDIIKEKDNLTFLEKNNIKDFVYENNTLSWSFLVLAGGNRLFNRTSIPTGEEDGLLTAKEISMMKFDGLDLVVLSACETARGTLGYDDSVLGLQKAFKRAGANTILMSLDKVDDEATKILMVEFYRNLMSGKTKHQSLKNAQKYLRSVENGKYDDPKYWASFIMLDGLN
jgi:Uncharacterized protein conserved in bacteria